MSRGAEHGQLRLRCGVHGCLAFVTDEREQHGAGDRHEHGEGRQQLDAGHERRGHRVVTEEGVAEEVLAQNVAGDGND